MPPPAASQSAPLAFDAGEQRFRELADNAPVMIWRSTPDKQCDWFNQRWLEFTGRRLPDEVGFGWTQGVHPDDLQRCVATYAAAFDGREPFRMHYRLRRSDGEYRTVLFVGAPYLRDGAFAGYVGSCIDVSEQQELEHHQQVLLSELQHRVKNNLQLIISFLALKARRVSTAEAREVLEEVIQRVRAVGAIQERLDASAGGGPVDLAHYLPGLSRDLVDAEGSGAVDLSVEAEPVRTTVSQASTLGLMVNELLTNAMKHAFAGKGGRLRLCVRALEFGRAEIIVEDDGPGFAPEVLAARLRPGARGAGLVDALARKVPAVLTRENHPGGASVRLLFAPDAD